MHDAPTLRRGNLIFNEVQEGDGPEGEEEEIEDDGEDKEDGEEGGADGFAEVKWSVPPGFEVADEPARLDQSLIGERVYLHWEKYGWQLGKITDVITEKTPQLFKKYNFRVMWADGTKGPTKLTVETYAYGDAARHDSWVILKEKQRD